MDNGWRRLVAMMGRTAAMALSGCAAKPTQITILATNDIHGGIEPNQLGDGSTQGGLAFSAWFAPSRQA
jgi:2',3'-cyclic-nucleotide 2'-phosphodiesterase (5'-nucleotidase family)